MSRKFRAYILLLVCMLMQAVAVFPHHHHAGIFCLHNDLMTCTTIDCCEQESSCSHHAEQHKCSTSCITHIQCRSQHIQSDDVLPNHSLSFSIYSIVTLLSVLIFGVNEVQTKESEYIERLHTESVLCGKGLRAPPALISVR